MSEEIMSEPAARRGAGDRGSALLVSGSIGMGHDALAAACAVTLEARGLSTQTLDAMRLLGRGGNSAGERVFRAMLAVPGLFDAFHFAGLRTGSKLALRADAAARRQLVPRLRRYLDEHPAALAISVFSTGASAISSLAPRYPAMSHVVFCTDVTPHRLWVHPNVDLYLVTSQVAEAAVRRFQPDARVLVMLARSGRSSTRRRPRTRPVTPSGSRAGSAACCSCRGLGAWDRSPPRRGPWATPGSTCSQWPGATRGWSTGWPRWPPGRGGSGPSASPTASRS